MSTLAEFMILSGGDNRPLILEKHMYDSWKSIMELYMQNREHGRMILESVEHGPLIWPTIEENGVTRIKKYAELSATEKIQADCDLKETNIILQGLPSDVYSLVNHHRVAKDLWERVQLLRFVLVFVEAAKQSAMSPFLPKKFCMGVAITTGRKGYYKPGTRAWVSRVSHKIRISIAMYPCRVKERLTIELIKGREVEKIVTTLTKNGVVTRYPRKFHEYQLTDKEKEIERMMIYWEQVEYEVSDDDDLALKSTAESVPKDYELEDT
ncbi:hypothetical protein Tco_1130091, partial [Tanacetum coccineum]